MERPHRLVLALTVHAIVLGACSSSESGSTGGDAGNAGDAASGADAASPLPDTCPVSPGTGCNTLSWGAVVPPTCSQELPPRATGGTITNGNYVLTAHTLYNNAPSSACEESLDRRGAAAWHSGTLDLAMDLDPTCMDTTSVNAKLRQTWTVSVTNGKLSGPESCDTYNSHSLSTNNTWSYTATANTLLLVGDYTVETYTLVP